MNKEQTKTEAKTDEKVGAAAEAETEAEVKLLPSNRSLQPPPLNDFYLSMFTCPHVVLDAHPSEALQQTNKSELFSSNRKFQYVFNTSTNDS